MRSHWSKAGLELEMTAFGRGQRRRGRGQDPHPPPTQSSGSWRGQETDRWACWAGFLSGRHRPGLPRSLQSQTPPGLRVVWGTLGALGGLGGSEEGVGILQQEGVEFQQGRARWGGLPVRNLSALVYRQQKSSSPARAAQAGRGRGGRQEEAPHEPGSPNTRVLPAPRGPSPAPPRGLHGRRRDPRCPCPSPLTGYVCLGLPPSQKVPPAEPCMVHY